MTSPSIYIVGAGIRVPDHLTLEAISTLQACEEIYTILSPSVSPYLPTEMQPKLRSLWPHYRPGTPRQDIYAAQVNAILAAADRHRPVGYLTLGNPIVFDSVTQGLLEAGLARGVDVVVLPSISSVDVLLVDLKQDMAPGLQVYEASAFVALDIVPRTDVNCLLLQVGTFGTSFTTIGHRQSRYTLSSLQDHLMRFYSYDHMVVYVFCSMHVEERASLFWMKVGELNSSDEIPWTNGGSLFLPRQCEPCPDKDFVSKMDNTDQFSQMYINDITVSS